MHWIWLIIAIVFEVAGTTCLKLSMGLSKLLPSFCAFLFYFICFASLAISLKKIEVAVAYAIWSGLGTALIAFIGIYFFVEHLSWIRMISIILIIAGVLGLNLTGA